MAPGFVVRPSRFGAAETLERLVMAVARHGAQVVARIDHAAAAAQAGLTLRPTTVVIFGNARVGTPLMQAAQTMGVDLPLKALVWQDEAGSAWLGYNDPAWLAERHDLGAAAAPVLAGMSATLASIAAEAADA